MQKKINLTKNLPESLQHNYNIITVICNALHKRKNTKKLNPYTHQYRLNQRYNLKG
jgi:hypothetical protein